MTRLLVLVLALVLAGCAGSGCYRTCRTYGMGPAYCAAWCVPPR